MSILHNNWKSNIIFVFFTLIILHTTSFYTSTSIAGTNKCEESKVKVKNISSQIRSLMRSKISEDAQKKKFSAIIKKNINVKKLGLFSLGKYARRISNKQAKVYLSLLSDMMVNLYFSKLKNYSDRSFKIKSVINKGKTQCIVSGDIITPKGKKIVSMSFWNTHYKGIHKIFDISVEGIWLAQQQRTNFTSILRKNKGDFNKLFAYIRSKTK